MAEDDPGRYRRGTVESYDNRAGYGYIRPDDDDIHDELLLVHQRSLRNRTDELDPGDRVSFRLDQVPRGLLAADVHAEIEASGDEFGYRETFSGTITNTVSSRGFGFVDVDGGRRAFFHFSYLADPAFVPTDGAQVCFFLTEAPQGLQAYEIVSEVPLTPTGVPLPADLPKSGALCTRDILAQALLERERRAFGVAARLYENGLRSCPSVQLVLSYAAMEKNRGRRKAAMEIYRRGIGLFPASAKLHEDAGVLSASLGANSKATALLQEGLRLCREERQRGEKGVLLALARTHYRMNTVPSLRQAVRYYDEARRLFSAGSRLPRADALALDLARMRVQHHRGNLVAQYFERAGFSIVRASLLEQMTVGADLIVKTDDTELTECYGTANHLLIRCMFKREVGLPDLESFEARIRDLGSSSVVDEQVGLLVLASVPENLERILFQKVESRKRSAPAIIPIPQEILEEKGATPLSPLRSILDRWLYRRDLFATNSPVVGKRFFGRDKVLAELRDAIDTGVATGIFGLRKVGKTSLLKEAGRRAATSGDLVVYIDLLRVPADVSDARWLYWKLAEEMRSQTPEAIVRAVKWRLGGVYRDFLDVPRDLPVASAFDADLSQLLQSLSTHRLNPKPRVVVLLDEIERIVPTSQRKVGFEGFFDFFSYLRGVCQESTDFILIITGANPSICETPQFDQLDNPVFNFFRETYLQLLEQPECALMMRVLGRGMGIRFTSGASDRVFSLTGGHPFFTRQLCSFIAMHHNQRPLEVTHDTVDTILDEYLEHCGKDFREIFERLSRDYPAERDVCLQLARAGGRLARRELSSAEQGQMPNLRHLLGYRIVRITGQDAELSMELLTRWLRKGYAYDS